MSHAVVDRVRVPKTKSAVKQNEDVETLKAICVVLQSVAQKHLPRDAFADKASLVQCMKLLAELDVNISVKANLKAEFDEPPTDKNTLSYRLLKNKTIAALATIADLDKKILDRMTSAYHNGMRDAYKKASEIALAFLADLQGESVENYRCVD